MPPSRSPTVRRLSVSRPDLAGNEERYVVDAIRSSWISSTGAYVDRFEREFAAFCGSRAAIPVRHDIAPAREPDTVESLGDARADEPLHGTSEATTVRIIRDGQTVTTDGPFAETKEQLGGYYIVECENLDQAIEAAARIPAARGGSIEVRPIADMDLPDAGPEGR